MVVAEGEFGLVDGLECLEDGSYSLGFVAEADHDVEPLDAAPDGEYVSDGARAHIFAHGSPERHEVVGNGLQLKNAGVVGLGGLEGVDGQLDVGEHLCLDVVALEHGVVLGGGERGSYGREILSGI